MTNTVKWLEYLVTLVLSLLILMDGALFIYLAVTERHSAKTAAIVYRHGENGPSLPPAGIPPRSTQVETESSLSGWVIRYGSRDCEFCRADDKTWRQMAGQLQALGYRVIILVPNAKEAYLNDTDMPAGANQLAYVSIGWIKQFRLTITPTTLIFNSHHDLIWSHQGVLSPSDPKAAIYSVKSAGL